MFQVFIVHNWVTYRQLIFFFLNPGTGKYIYIETSSPRNPGDNARLEGPWMRGPQCMTFFYHMRGSTMSCVIIYIRSMATYRYKLVWLKSEDRGNHWLPAKISINTTEIFQVSSSPQSVTVWQIEQLGLLSIKFLISRQARLWSKKN